MDARREIGDFLQTRRARIQPEEAGLPAFGERRRVPGLRREEVAMLSGISVEYYTRLERGNVGDVSDSVLDGLARALQLNQAETSHLENLVTAANTTRSATPDSDQGVGRGLHVVLDSVTHAAAFLRNHRLDVLANNALARALYLPLLEAPTEPPNLARLVFLDERSTVFYADWQQIADDAVGSLRIATGRFPEDEYLMSLIDELSRRSDEFQSRWETHHVEEYRSGQQHFRHPEVGELVLLYEAFELVSDPTVVMIVYCPKPGSVWEARFKSLNETIFDK
ncbi:MAG: helix-turn-helix transcriptional regulator [Actinomycetota bacterium]|nr:helix-turn-helix transcriptional regulator [Actinomycetota bacterium]